MNARYTSYCQIADLADSQDFLTQIRHHLHKNPVLSFKEIATSELVATRLTEWGYEAWFKKPGFRVTLA